MSDSSRKSHGIGAAVDKLFRGIEILIAIFLGAMIFFTFMNVILRQFGIGFPWSEEIARICFIYLIYLGAIIAARENQHLMIDTLICKLPPLGQKVLYVIIQGLIIWLMWILTNGAFLEQPQRLLGRHPLPGVPGPLRRRAAGRVRHHHLSGESVPYVCSEGARHRAAHRPQGR